MFVQFWCVQYTELEVIRFSKGGRKEVRRLGVANGGNMATASPTSQDK